MFEKIVHPFLLFFWGIISELKNKRQNKTKISYQGTQARDLSNQLRVWPGLELWKILGVWVGVWLVTMGLSKHVLQGKMNTAQVMGGEDSDSGGGRDVLIVTGTMF